MTREEAIRLLSGLIFKGKLKEALDMAIKALEQEPCEDWYDVPSNEMILERARQASKDLRKRFKEDLEQEPCDEYGNYRYPGDIELTEPNTATSMPCGDAISRQAVLEIAKSSRSNWIDNSVLFKRVNELPSVNPAKTGHWILKRTFPTKLYDEYLNEYKCSECYSEIRCTENQLVNYPYCHCGAKMFEPQESDVLDKIRAEIKALIEWHDCPIEYDNGNDAWYCEACNQVLNIIDKYKAESEDKE